MPNPRPLGGNEDRWHTNSTPTALVCRRTLRACVARLCARARAGTGPSSRGACTRSFAALRAPRARGSASTIGSLCCRGATRAPSCPSLASGAHMRASDEADRSRARCVSVARTHASVARPVRQRRAPTPFDPLHRISPRARATQSLRAALRGAVHEPSDDRELVGRPRAVAVDPGRAGQPPRPRHAPRRAGASRACARSHVLLPLALCRVWRAR